MINFVVVEDNKLQQKMINDIVVKYMMKNKLEFNILNFEKDSKELRNVIKKNDYNHVYILDFELPNSNAIDIARMIRENDWISPIIVFTAHGGMELKTYQQRLQILDFVPKQYEGEKNLIELFDICLVQLNLSKSLKIKIHGVDYNIAYNKILYIYRDTSTRKIIVVTNHNEHSMNMSLKNIMQLLSKDFKFSHKACIVNMKRVEAIDWHKRIVHFDDGKTTDLLSKTHKKELNEYVNV